MEAKYNKYAQAESVYEQYFIGNRIGYKDTINLTQAVDSYGEEIVLEAMRKLYKMGKTDIDNFSYIEKTARSIYDQRSKPSTKGANINPQEDMFKSEAQKQREQDSRMRYYEQRKRMEQIRGFIRGDIRTRLYKRGQGFITTQLDSWVKGGGDKPQEALTRWMLTLAEIEKEATA